MVLFIFSFSLIFGMEDTISKVYPQLYDKYVSDGAIYSIIYGDLYSK